MNKRVMKLKKISWKLTLSYAAMFSLVLIILSVGIVYGMRYYLTDQAVIQIRNSASITTVNITDTINEQSQLTDPELLSEAVANSQISVIIADENGQIVNASDRFNDNNISILSDYGMVRNIKIKDNRFVVLNTRVIVDGQVRAYFQVAKNMVSEYEFIKVAMITMGIADVFGILISLFVGYLIGKRMLKPLDKITKTAKEISVSDLSRKIEVKGNDDELDRLAKTFNEMIERLRLSFEKQNSFVSDASHELRTPISVIRGYIDLVDRWGKNDKAVLEEAIAAIKNETQDMGDMVEKLLFLARSDTGKLVIEKERFNLLRLIEELILEYKMISPEQIIRTEFFDNIEVSADRNMLKQALRAVIDNSIKYNPDHKEIKLSASAKDKETVISIQDYGIGIPKDKLDGIFERFYRVDSARERKTGGSGLGLSIVETIISAHEGRIKAESEPGEGTLITIVLPEQTSS